MKRSHAQLLRKLEEQGLELAKLKAYKENVVYEGLTNPKKGSTKPYSKKKEKDSHRNKGGEEGDKDSESQSDRDQATVEIKDFIWETNE